MLFSANKDEKPLAKQQGAFLDNSNASGFSLQSLADIKANIGELKQNFHYHFWSKGQWSMHELLDYLIRQIGPADVYLTTWTVTEDPVRRLFMLKKEGLISSLHCVLDYRIKGRKPAPFQLLEQTADSIKLSQCHAKSLVIISPNWSVSVVGSANFSKNPRLEVGVICTVPEVVKFNLNVIKNELET